LVIAASSVKAGTMKSDAIQGNFSFVSGWVYCIISRRNKTGTLTPPKYSIFDQRNFAEGVIDEVSNNPPNDHHAVKSKRAARVRPPETLRCLKAMIDAIKEITIVSA
jgi:hypothetical protein